MRPSITRRTRSSFLAAGAVSTVAVLSLGAAAPALAASPDVVVTDRETVQAYLTPTGKVKVARVYDQVTATGSGTVEIDNPVETKGLRNLDGLGSPTVRDGKTISKISVDGEKRMRTVSDFDEKKLPVTIKATYTLNGKAYADPEDLVGKSGDLAVSYRVENVTSKQTTITVKDGKGEDVERTVSIPTPLVGSLVTVLPKSFYSVASDQATMSADGRGGTRMTFTMTLLPPIGSTVAKIGYTAKVSDAVIPKATVSIAVVQPLKNPSLSTAASSYRGGAKTGKKLTAGAEQIDTNLLKLRDGAGQLLGGLVQLREGAQQLNAGLSGSAAPGANKLADGAGKASNGASKLATGLRTAASGSGALADGVGKVADGNKTLATGFNNPTGAPDLVSGSQALASGVGLISGGLSMLAGVDGLPKAYAGLQTLRLGLDHPIGALGATDPGGLLQGLQRIAGGLSNSACNPTDPRNVRNPCGVKQSLAVLAAGLSNPACSLEDPSNPANPCGLRQGLGAVAVGLTNPACDTANPSNPANPCGVREGVVGVKAGLDDGLRPDGGLDQLKRAALGAYTATPACLFTPAPAPPGTVIPPPTSPVTKCDFVAAFYYGIEAPTTGLRARSRLASSSLGSVRDGLDGQLSPGVTKLIEGVGLARDGLAGIRAGVDQLAVGSAAARDGVKNQVLPGVDQLLAGISGAVTGVNQLSTGAKTAATGSGTLAAKIAVAGDGAQQLADGSRQAQVGSRKLADGLVAARTGAAQLADGNAQIATGAGALATGLDNAAAGSSKLADGLATAADGAPALVDGANRLSKKGTQKLVAAGNDTTVEFGEKYAILDAMNELTKDGGLPYGAPANASGASAAYSFELAAASHEGSRNLTRGVLALIALGVGAAVSTVVRTRLG